MIRKAAAIALILVFSVALAAAASGCTKDGELTVEQYVWQMSTVSEGGKVTYVSSENAAAYPDAEVAKLTLVAADGKLELRIGSEKEPITGSYMPAKVNRADEKIYKADLFYSGEEYMTLAYTEYEDGSSAPTLIIAKPGTDGYAIYFYGTD